MSYKISWEVQIKNTAYKSGTIIMWTLEVNSCKQFGFYIAKRHGRQSVYLMADYKGAQTSGDICILKYDLINKWFELHG